MTYYEIIRALREDNDMTQTELGKILQTNQRRISRIETGTSEITISELIRVCKYFRVSADYILSITF